MGIRLETVLPDKRFLWRLATARLALSFLCFVGLVLCFRSPAEDALSWLIRTLLLLGCALGLFFAGLYPLCFLQRRVEFYENGISAEPYEIPLGGLEKVCWKQSPFKVLRLFPLPVPPRYHMICVYHAEKGHTKRFLVSGYYFPGLQDAFDSAYEHSIPWEITAWRGKGKARRGKAAAQAQSSSVLPSPDFIGPPVPPPPSIKSGPSDTPPDGPSEPT